MSVSVNLHDCSKMLRKCINDHNFFYFIRRSLIFWCSLVFDYRKYFGYNPKESYKLNNSIF